MTHPFTDAVALVTGGASGLGRGLVEALAARGARVVIADIDEAGARALAEALQSAGRHARAVRLDVTDPAAVRAAIDGVAATEGRLDYVFNNAGVAVGGEVQDVDTGAIRRIIDINLTGAIFVMQAAYVQMLRQHSGHIVNIASMYGLFPAIVQSVYAATKHGLVAMSVALAAEARHLGVRVTAICPGYVRTNLFAAGSYGGDLDAARALERIPFELIEVSPAVETILRGVQRRRLFVVFPLYVRLIWWLHRLSPWLLHWFNARIMRQQRAEFGSTAAAPALPRGPAG